MSQSVAFWAIFACNGRRHLLFRFNEKQNAESTLASLNEGKVKEYFYLTMIKEPITAMPRQFVKVDWDDREVKIPFETKSGEKRLARKHFRDVTVQWIVEGRYTFIDTMTVHRHRGVLKVILNGNSMDFERFEKLANESWPENANEILDPMWSL